MPAGERCRRAVCGRTACTVRCGGGRQPRTSRLRRAVPGRLPPTLRCSSLGDAAASEQPRQPRPRSRGECRSPCDCASPTGPRAGSCLGRGAARCGARGDRCIRPAERETARRYDPSRVARRGKAGALPWRLRACGIRPPAPPASARARRRCAKHQPTTWTPRRAVPQEESSRARRPDKRFSTKAVAGSRPARATAMATIQHSAAAGASLRFATVAIVAPTAWP